MLRADAVRDAGPGARGQPRERDDDVGRADRALCCARCGHEITRVQARTAVEGSHEHTRVNPHGYSFHFGCFERAPGAQSLGEQTAHYSWFAGYRWQMDHCRACGLHLGWLYCTNSHRFHGLILDRLVDGASGTDS